MATTAVGVRELKLHAPTLVARAARGEHIVISRYGKPQAQLGPIEAGPSEAPAQGSRMVDWLAEKAHFEAMSSKLEEKYRGRYVAIHGRRVVGADADPEQLYQRTSKKLRGRTFFIGRVGGPPPIVDMPGFEVDP
jgi:antitoxin (DNA-binding transcriptional repressor) of toxin-antitoxin stability system